MKKELVLLNELSSLFIEDRSYKIEYSVLIPIIGLNKGSLHIEIEFTDEELDFVKKTTKGRIIDGHGVLLDLPTRDGKGNPIKKCLCFMFVLEENLHLFSYAINQYD